jgi:hypothetical protein
MQHIITIERTARKEYACCACEWLSELDDFRWFSFAEKRQVVNLLRKKKGVISKGEKYMHCTYKYDGGIQVSRYLQEAHELCKKHDVYCYD